MTFATDITYLFTDLEGSTRLWEQWPEKMRVALAQHDAMTRSAVACHGGQVVKMTGDGAHAAFDDALSALQTAFELQRQMESIAAQAQLPLRLRCGLHLGQDQRRDNDFFGPAVNRAARVMCAAHGGQVLLSQAVACAVQERLPSSWQLRDLGRVRLKDLAQPEHLHQLLHPQLRAEFPALRSLEATPNNLTQQLNSFVGREAETLALRKLLQSNRLVTLLGMGGIGKSRLSVQLGAELLDQYLDGVWLVELAPLSDPQLVPQAVATVLGVKEETGCTVVEALSRFVSKRQLLIILDNCEHLIAACAALTKQLLQAAPQLTVLASSRDHLNIAGETAYQVPTLDVPLSEGQINLHALMANDAVRLFVDRAIAAQHRFQLTEFNASAVVSICQQLDGIPLALELAAARIRSMTVDVIATRLADRFRLLSTHDQTVLPRQRTLRALIDWSYDLLSESERRVFERLSLFAGGWTLDAAEAVCTDDQVCAGEVVDLLARLVEKSLVVLDIDSGRYRMLETVRAYAHEKFQQQPSAGLSRQQHLTYFVCFAEAARPYLTGAEQGQWLDKVDQERENILVAHERADDSTSARRLRSRLVRALRMYFIYRGYVSLGLRLYLSLLDHAQTADLAERCRVLFGTGQFSWLAGRYSDARKYFEQCLQIANEIEDQYAALTTHGQLGHVCMAEKDLNAARGHFELALHLARQANQTREISVALTELARLYRMQEDFAASEAASLEALTLARHCGDQEMVGRCLLNQALIALDRGEAVQTQSLLKQAVALAQGTRLPTLTQYVFDACCGYFCLLAQWERAARLLALAEVQLKQSGLSRDPVDQAFLLPLLEKARSQLGLTAFTAASSAATNAATNNSTSADQALLLVNAWLSD